MKVFRDEGFHMPVLPPLPHEDWVKAIGRFSRVCVDIIIFDEDTETCLLPFRIHPPKHNQRWPIGGGIRPAEDLGAAAQRKFLEETGLHVALERFHELDEVRYLVAGPPTQDAFVHRFSVSLTTEELKTVSKGLDRSEYDRSRGLEMFNCDTIETSNLDPYVIDFFHAAIGDEK